MVLLTWNKGDFTEVMLYAGLARIHRNFPGGHWMQRTACTKVWRPDHGAFELRAHLIRTWRVEEMGLGDTHQGTMLQ